MSFTRFPVVLSIALLSLSVSGSLPVHAKMPIHAKMPKAAPVPAAASGPERVETTTYNSWTVSCREIVGAANKKTCSAILRVVDRGGHPLMAWIIGLDRERKLTSVIRTPTGVTLTDKSSGAKTTGLMIRDGLNLEFGKLESGKPTLHHLSYLLCEPQWCEASGPMDERFVKDTLAAKDAVIIIYAAGDRAVRYPSIPLKGIDKAIAMVRR
jgi:invasion protein IalB